MKSAARTGLLLILAGQCQLCLGFAVVAEHSTNTFPVAGNDLLQEAGVVVDASMLNINIPESAGNTVATLNDGLFPGEDRALAIADGTLTYYLDTSANSNGYDLTRLETFGGWVNAGRSWQQYDVSFARVEDPSNFVGLVSGVDSGVDGTYVPSYTAVTVTNQTGRPMASRVVAIRFTFPPQVNGGAGYRELDLFGEPSVPLTVTDVAESILAVPVPIRGGTDLELPAVPLGFSLGVAYSSHPGIVGLGGTIQPPPTNTVVELVLTVADGAGGQTADTQTIPLFVPAAVGSGPWVSYADNFSMCRGLFIHWGAPPDGILNPVLFSDGTRSTTLDGFAYSADVPAVVAEIARLGFEYVILTDFHGYHTVLHPCAAITAWRGPGYTSSRDLTGEMVAALKAEGIPVYLFTHPLDGINGFTLEQQERVGWYDAVDGYRRWNDYLNGVYAEIVERYGDDLAGIGFDSEFGMVNPQVRGKLDLHRLRETILSRRPHLSLHGLFGPNDLVELGMKEVYRPSWLDPWDSRPETDTDVETWPAYRRFPAIVQGYHWATVTLPEQGRALLAGEKLFRYSVLQAAASTEGPGVAWAASPYTDGRWENGVQEAFEVLEDLTAPVRESLRDVLPSTSYPVEEGAWIRDLPHGIAATRALDDTVEYIHVLNPPAGDTLTLPLAADGKRFSSATLLGNGNPVGIATNSTELMLTLGGTDTWNATNTAIKLLVEAESIPPRNLALHKPVFESSSIEYQGWTVPNPWGRIRLVDGQVDAIAATNGWSDGNYGFSSKKCASNCTEWIGIDLESVNYVKEIRMHPRNDAGNLGCGYPVDFEISTSVDGTNWLVAATVSGEPQPAVAQHYAFPTRAARYVRINAGQLRSNPNDGGLYSFQLAELEAMGFTKLPVLDWEAAAGSLVLQWEDGVLQSADSVDAAFSDVPGAEPPYDALSATNAPRQFYRLRY